MAAVWTWQAHPLLVNLQDKIGNILTNSKCSLRQFPKFKWNFSAINQKESCASSLRLFCSTKDAWQTLEDLRSPSIVWWWDVTQGFCLLILSHLLNIPVSHYQIEIQLHYSSESHYPIAIQLLNPCNTEPNGNQAVYFPVRKYAVKHQLHSYSKHLSFNYQAVNRSSNSDPTAAFFIIFQFWCNNSVVVSNSFQQ